MTLRTYTLLLCIMWAGSSAAQKTLIGLTRGEQGHVIEYNLASGKLNIPPATTGNALPWYNDLIQASNGKLYGMTESGGSFNKGTIFSYDPLTNLLEVIYNDFGKDRSHPASSFGSLTQLKLTTGKESILYGMTESGGEYGYGTIFSYNIKTKSLTTLHHFNKVNGSSPYGSLLEASNGMLYGVTESGGANDFGTVFSFNPVTNQHSLLHEFKVISGTDNKTTAQYGRSPYGSLVELNNELYGVAQYGGTHISTSRDLSKNTVSYGVIFSITLDGHYKRRADFRWNNGAWPNSTLVKAGNKLYGTTESGGANNYGVVYAFDPATNSIEHIDFTETETLKKGRLPYGKLTLASDGSLYGMTFRGGLYDKGVLYSLAPGTLTIEPKVHFNGTNGMNPAASLLEVNIVNTPLPLTLLDFYASTQNNKVQLHWDVEQEFDIVKYDVERSTDGTRFTTIGTVMAVNSQGRHQYSFTDHQPASGKNFYRLKIVERFKAPHYSDIKVINRGKATFGVTVQPNPVAANATIHVNLQNKSKVQMALYNAQGILLKQWPAVTFDKGAHNIPLQLTDVPNGSYILIVEAGKNKQTVQLIKNISL